MADDLNLIALADFAARHEVRVGRTLVVGSKCYGDKPDRRTLYPMAVGVDLFDGDGVDVRHDLEKPLPKRLGRFEHVDCCSVLEHVRRPWLFCENIEAAMVEGGTILVAVPFVWRVHGYPSDYWRMTPDALPVLFPRIAWVSMGFLVNGRMRKRVPSKDECERKFLERAEVVAFGVRCESDS